LLATQQSAADASVLHASPASTKQQYLYQQWSQQREEKEKKWSLKGVILRERGVRRGDKMLLPCQHNVCA
jgi:hypothetical protein